MRLFLVLCLGLFSTIVFSAEFVVTHGDDSGEGSLRWAIKEANLHSGADTVRFAIPQSDPSFDSTDNFWTIVLYSTLTSVTDDSLFIDGYSQRDMLPQATADQPLIQVSGYGITGDSHGLLLWSAYNRVRGLSLGGFRGATMWIKSQFAHHNCIEGCHIGVLPDGLSGMYDVKQSNFGVESSRGIYISQGAHHNQIGGAEDGQRNIICNMYYEALLIEESSENIIQGNYIGVLKNGTQPLGNGWIDVPRYDIENRKLQRYPAVHIYIASAKNTIGGAEPGQGNVICASGRAGIRIEHAGSDSNVVQGNYLGVGADGEYHENLGNAEAGLKIQREAHRNCIGGEDPGAGNVISGNGSSGLQLRENTRHNRIIGNHIGLNAAGTARVPNGHNGVYLFGQKDKGFPQYNQIGPGNIIIANGEEREEESNGLTWAAVRMDSAETAFNSVFENRLGTNASGTLGSDYNSGVIVGGGAHDNTIGPNNTIANNKKYGVWVRQSGSSRNTITQNFIYENGRKAIFLSEGGNTMLPAPTDLVVSDSQVSGSCEANGQVELFSADGRTFLGSVTAGANGYFSWSGDPGGESVLTSVTDTDGNTSEYSESGSVPVELSLFRVERLPQGVQITWRTESETNNLGFYVERSTDDNFVEIAFVPGNGTTVEPATYSFVDEIDLLQPMHYRLRQVDFDGSTTVSTILTVDAQLPQSFELTPPYPNPFNGSTVFRCRVPERSTVIVEVFNGRGQRIRQLMNRDMPAGELQLFWDGTDDQGRRVSSGLYFFSMRAGSEQLVQRVLLIQ